MVQGHTAEEENILFSKSSYDPKQFVPSPPPSNLEHSTHRKTVTESNSPCRPFCPLLDSGVPGGRSLEGTWHMVPPSCNRCAVLGQLCYGKEMSAFPKPSQAGCGDSGLLLLAAVTVADMNIHQPAPLKNLLISHLCCHLITICGLCQKAHCSIKERL